MQHYVLLTTESSGLLTIETRILLSSRECTLAARGVVDVSPGQPCFIIVSNFSNSEVYVPNNTNITYAAIKPSIIHTVDTIDRNNALIRTPKADANYITSEVMALIGVTQHHTGSHDVLAVHCKPSKSRETQILRYTAIQSVECHQQARK